VDDVSLVVLFSGEPMEQSRDAVFAFIPNPNCYYVTGIQEESLVYMMTKVNGKCEETVFINRFDERKQKFDGELPTPQNIPQRYGIQNVRYKDEMNAILGRLLYDEAFENLYVDVAKWKVDYPDKPADKFAKLMQAQFPYLRIRDLNALLTPMRLVKDPEEIAAIERAAEVTGQGIRDMLAMLKPGLPEYKISSHFAFRLLDEGLGRPGFDMISGSGPNTCCMHYHGGDRVGQDGDLILFDLGAQCQRYSCDVSRTYPLNGKYSEKQKAVYEAVLAVQLRVIDEVFKPGVPKSEVFTKTKDWLMEEGIKRGLFATYEEGATHYYHGPTHPIGLDVHDVMRNDFVFEENMVFAFEPGLYFPEWEIGVRIEDTLVITKDGCRVLTESIPKLIPDVEAALSTPR